MFSKDRRHKPKALQTGPALPQRLLDELGDEAGGCKAGSGRPAAGGVARKARRKQERLDKAQRVRAALSTSCAYV